MNNLTIFENSTFGQIRTTTINDEPWFVGKDVAIALGYTNPRKVIREHVDNEDKKMGCQNDTPSESMGERNVPPSIKDSLGRLQVPVWINESGLYSLIFSSKLPQAKQFKRWVTSEVLPTLRKTGQFSTKPRSMEEYMEIAKMVVKCPNKRLPILIEVLEKAGFEFNKKE